MGPPLSRGRGGATWQGGSKKGEEISCQGFAPRLFFLASEGKNRKVRMNKPKTTNLGVEPNSFSS